MQDIKPASINNGSAPLDVILTVLVPKINELIAAHNATPEPAPQPEPAAAPAAAPSKSRRKKKA